MIRRLKQADVQQLNEMLRRIPQFTPAEIEVAMELINIAAGNLLQRDYFIYVYDYEEKVLGYHCVGERPLTTGTYDLYWIAADPSAPIKGVGSKLLKHAEDFVINQNGRLILAETSSKESYSNTRNFYLRNNYEVVSQINDFYSSGDSLIIFGKYFNNNIRG
jgi:GNAT superfamily N-acetyltransferase